MTQQVIETESGLSRKLQAIVSKIGNTPLFKLSPQIIGNASVNIFAKQEWMQFGSSVKARAAFRIISEAVRTGALSEEKVLLDATSGNTGIAYAQVAKAAGLRVTLCLPENASAERKHILKELGVEIIYTSKFEGTDGAQQEALRLASSDPGKYFYADQYKNDNNWLAHYHTTALEIVRDVPDITHFVAGLGTTGTFTGTGRRLREINSNIRLIGLQPDSALHGLEGWKHLETAVVPKIYDASLADEIIEVTTEESYEILKKVKQEHGILLSPSSAANLAGAIRVAEQIESGNIVTVLPDNADKYSEVINKLFK
jgi:S-sulfo-L-cysteine synthase (O-acetyl-L-serine-dependent)